MKILLIVDEEMSTNSLELSLASDGISCDIVNLGSADVKLEQVFKYDAIVLDIEAPHKDGFEILKRFRATGVKNPILVLSAEKPVDEQVKMLDKIEERSKTSPVTKSDLLAKLQIVIRRSKNNAKSVLRVGKITLDLESRAVMVSGNPLRLTSKEYGVLELLMMCKGTQLTKAAFLKHLYSGIEEPELKIVDVFVCKLRKKIAKMANGENYIETLWGRGYMMKDPSDDASPNSGGNKSANITIKDKPIITAETA